MSNIITSYSDDNKIKHSVFGLESPFSAVIYGIPNSGKTYFLMNLIKDIKQDFDEIILFLGAKDTADSFLKLIDTTQGTHIHETFQEGTNDHPEAWQRLDSLLNSPIYHIMSFLF